ncbi:hypothetical protein HDU81_002746 [Chytriomyces hyalinus]|nr:hypothetical protein HDU81_002746 [Chytriomyces hyalinus]
MARNRKTLGIEQYSPPKQALKTALLQLKEQETALLLAQTVLHLALQQNVARRKAITQRLFAGDELNVQACNLDIGVVPVTALNKKDNDSSNDCQEVEVVEEVLGQVESRMTLTGEDVIMKNDEGLATTITGVVGKESSAEVLPVPRQFLNCLHLDPVVPSDGGASDMDLPAADPADSCVVETSVSAVPM